MTDPRDGLGYAVWQLRNSLAECYQALGVEMAEGTIDPVLGLAIDRQLDQALGIITNIEGSIT